MSEDLKILGFEDFPLYLKMEEDGVCLKDVGRFNRWREELSET